MGDASNDRIASYLDLVSTYDRAYTFEELTDLAHPDIDPDELQNALKSDTRFVSLGSDSAGQEYFVATEAFFLWFTKLSARLARAHQSRLFEHQLTKFLNSFCVNGQWNIMPARAAKFGQCFGFIGPTCTSGQYVFPLAHILSLIPASTGQNAGAGLAKLYRQYLLGASFEELLRKSLDDGLSDFDSRVRHVVQARAGLMNSGGMTLERIGVSLGITRERVRQLESKFWDKLGKYGKRRHFVLALLCDTMRNHGRLIVEADSSDALVRRFIAQCVGIPQTIVPHTKLILIGALAKDVPKLKSTGWFPEETDISYMAARLESDPHFCLIDEDLKVLTESLVQFRRKQLTRGQMAYLALKAIGKPAHSAEIAEVYNSLFPERPSIEHNLHAVLSRQEYGVVWIGLRSTFALKEWGYEHPPKTLFSTVAEIVANRFRETGNPVPFEVIIAEIGKYRKVVRPASITIAAYCNPALRRVSKESFVPEESTEQSEEEISKDELDRILKEFELGTVLGQGRQLEHKPDSNALRHIERSQETNDVIREVEPEGAVGEQIPGPEMALAGIAADTETQAPTPENGIKRVVECPIYNYPPEFFFGLAHWAKVKEELNPWERRLAFDIGRYRAQGWLISGKQERHGLRIIEKAMKLGFSQGEGKAGSTAEDVEYHS